MRGAGQRATAFLSACALLLGTLATGGPAGAQQPRAERLSEEQRILHVLNRLGFGARPGDVERVRAMGLARYIEQQLQPEKIADPVADAKVQTLGSLRLSTAEIYAKYPQPNQLLRQLERRGELPPELAAASENRKKADAPVSGAVAAAASQQNESAAMAGLPAGVTEGAAAASAAKEEDGAKGRDPAYRRAIRDYYIAHDLRQPQQLVQELQASRVLRAVYSERQLQEVMVDFWTNHFNIFANKGADKWLLTSYDRDTIRPHTLGKFYDLLVATAESPAMLFYLDNFQSVSPKAAGGGNNRRGARPARERGRLLDMLMGGRAMRSGEGAPRNRRRQQQPDSAGANMPAEPQPAAQQRPKRGINENYARELMELHTLGVEGGYTQKDVQEVARCFTGWTILNPRGGATALNGASEKIGTFYFNPRLHDDGEKLVLGHKIAAGGGIEDGLKVLDILAHHPSTAKFIATKLSRRFVTDNPSPALVERVAAAYTRSDGDIRETLRAVFASPEFNSPASYRAKIKTPFELAVSAIRTLGGETNGTQLHQWIARMGEPLYAYQAPTGYPDVAENWVNTGALLQRLNFGLALASNRIPGTRVNLARFDADTAKGSTDMTRMMQRFLDLIVQGDVSPSTKASLMKQLSEPVTPSPAADSSMMNDAPERTRGGGGRRAQRQLAVADLASTANPELVKLVGLILGSPEFQRQ
jgi:uncharacterized protein (DUF1800 family)